MLLDNSNNDKKSPQDSSFSKEYREVTDSDYSQENDEIVSESADPLQQAGGDTASINLFEEVLKESESSYLHIPDEYEKAKSLIEGLKADGLLMVRSQTPVSKTGSKCQKGDMSTNTSPRFSTRLDWLQGTFKFLEDWHPEWVCARLGTIFTDTFDMKHGAMTSGIKFKYSARATNGILLAWNLPTQDSPGFAWLSVPGRALGSVDIYGLILLFDMLSYSDICIGWKATRFDACIDDYHKKITPQLVYAAALAGNYSGFRYKPEYDQRTESWKPPSYRLIDSPHCDSEGNLFQARTVNFGSKQSDKIFYIYDKWAESDGEIDSTRLECRYFDDRANSCYLRVLDILQNGTNDEYYQVLGSIVSGSINFIDRSSGVRASRCPLLPFWAELLEEIPSIKIPVLKVVKVLENTVDWVLHQWETSLAILESVAGYDEVITFVNSLINSGKTRLASTHSAIIKQSKEQAFNLKQYVEIRRN